MTASNLALAAIGVAACTIDECNDLVVARGLCNRHYKRWRKLGGKTQPRMKHGEGGRTPEYFIWNRMTREPEGRCQSWASFRVFIVDMGRRRTGSRLLRKDTNLPFGPDNCFWSLSKVNGPTSRQRMSEAKRERVVVDGETLFRCGGECQRFLPGSAFYKLSENINGIRSRCKRCHRALVMRTRDVGSVRENKRRSEARRRARKSGSISLMTRKQELELERVWGVCCLKCGAVEKLTWDHIVPLSIGGPHCITNIQRLCRSCNERKHTSISDFRSSGQIEWANIMKEAG